MVDTSLAVVTASMMGRPYWTFDVDSIIMTVGEMVMRTTPPSIADAPMRLYFPT